jgi:hypothetical protein
MCLGSIFFATGLLADSKKAVFKAPVADVFFRQLSTVYGNKLPLEVLYYASPLFATTVWGCPRAIQCLFNEVVDVLDVVGGEVCIAAPHIFYTVADRASGHNFLVHNVFWTHANNLLFFDKDNDLLLSIPEPIDYRVEDSVVNNQIVTLTMPWSDSITGKVYSVGTRFIRKPENDTESFFAICLLDTKPLRVKESFIPRSYAVAYQELSFKARQDNFVALLKTWADERNGIVPYVWGGTSITNFVSDDKFEPAYGKFAGKLIALWSHRESVAPYSGMDCSLMIFRAAQICGIPYFFKNSYTISQYLRPLQKGEMVESGDIIWYDGHVMVVSDSVNNKIIESCGYPFGFGKVQEIELGKRLADMHTFDDLLEEYFGTGCLGSLDREGIVRRIIEHFEIFKLSSVWES